MKELYNQVDKDKLANFWGTFQDMWLLLYGSRLITMAAVTVLLAGANSMGGVGLGVNRLGGGRGDGDSFF